MAVTMPKLPPPPRTAQNRSGSFSRVDAADAPSAVTISTAATLWRPGRAAGRASSDRRRACSRPRRRRVRSRPARPARTGRGLGDLGPQDAGLDPRRAARGVDLDPAHPLRLHEDGAAELSPTARPRGRCPAVRRAACARRRMRRRPPRRRPTPEARPARGAGRSPGSRRRRAASQASSPGSTMSPSTRARRAEGSSGAAARGKLDIGPPGGRIPGCPSTLAGASCRGNTATARAEVRLTARYCGVEPGLFSCASFTPATLAT